MQASPGPRSTSCLAEPPEHLAPADITLQYCLAREKLSRGNIFGQGASLRRERLWAGNIFGQGALLVSALQAVPGPRSTSCLAVVLCRRCAHPPLPSATNSSSNLLFDCAIISDCDIQICKMNVRTRDIHTNKHTHTRSTRTRTHTQRNVHTHK